MASNIEQAVELSKKYRYSEDKIDEEFEHKLISGNYIKKTMYSNGLQITRELTPKLYGCLKKACERLLFPIENVSAFVSLSSDFQAMCIQTNDTECIVNISSNVVDLLDLDELIFVIGHEIGHCILGHGKNSYSKTIEGFVNERAKEISCDRAGLIACESLEVALKAKMKFISGLSEKHLNLDVSSFINQLRLIDENQISINDSLTTHPPTIIRAKALLWFSMNEDIEIGGRKGSVTLNKIDELVTKDLNRYVDNPAKDEISQLEKDLYFWMCCKTATTEGKLSKEQKDKLMQEFGEQNIKKFINVVSDLDINEVKDFIESKVMDSLNNLSKVAPNSIKQRIKDLTEKSFSILG